MRVKRLRGNEPREWLLIFDIDDEVVSVLEEFAVAESIGGAWLTGLGAFREATLAYWNWESKSYEDLPVREQVEVVSLTGNLAHGPDESPILHAHVVIGRQDGSAGGGHLRNARVRPTLEVRVQELPTAIKRRRDASTGLTLLVAE
jgi:predicted DNA-binding protein with PD1-like motif